MRHGCFAIRRANDAVQPVGTSASPPIASCSPFDGGCCGRAEGGTAVQAVLGGLKDVASVLVSSWW